MKHLAILAWLALAAMLLTLPLWAHDALLHFAIDALLFVTLAQSWNVIGGYGGYPSFGNSVFYGIGAYGVGIATVQWHWPFAAGLALGAFSACVFAVIFGMPLLRLRGHYFAIATLGLAQVTGAVVANLAFAGANIGLVLPLVNDDRGFYTGALVLAAAATLSIRMLARSRFGFALIAIREDEDAAAAMGIDTTRFKIAAFAFAALLASLAGGIHAYWVSFLEPGGAFDPTLNVEMIIMAVFGGPGTALGPVAGALLLTGVSAWLAVRVTALATLFFGVVIVVAVVTIPRGLSDALHRLPRDGPRYLLANIRRNRL
jgi:branched-chain amino acid transport system permease protein